MDKTVETEKRVVVEGRWDGNILPGRVEELNRELIVRPGAHITGGVFGRLVQVEGPVEIERAVYASEELEVIAKGDTRFHSSIGSRNVVYVRGADGRVLIAGDVCGKNIRLENCAIRGSVHGTEVRLERCLVLGAVHGTDFVELRDTVALMVYGQRLVFNERCALVLPYAQATVSCEILSPVSLLGFPADDNVLTSDDIVFDNNGVSHLSAGRRLTDLARTREHLANLKGFMSRVALQEMLGSSSSQIPYARKQLPHEVSQWIDSGVIQGEAVASE